ncbi:hypothetical protein BKN38_09610 [Helicobacter sp. CLO-3]|uniref:ribosome maturation factor RimP n=1 Tax=unclassified Helicobacter TaxID=2593540 RepID=UPI00080489C9|nr:MULTISPECIES: ribosome maturation factor RimP [unclassified Helicobacter]OBV28573.1 hypothetical protein BA723_08910 [Helicobacter sp. CLO-3]OHU81161.1 hypothetical protein BKN38_09610 [Helicobacter sp. CLO-3]
MDFTSIQDDIESIIAPLSCKLYDISLLRENDTQILRISIMADDGNTTLDICQAVSEAVSPFLDVKDVIKDAYTLEVSSPGIERALKNPRHFMLSIGERVSMKLVDKSEIEGALIKADENGVWVEAGKGSFGSADSGGVDSSGVDFGSADFGASESSGAGGDTSSAKSSALDSGASDSSGDKLAGANAVFIPYSDIRRAKTIFEW